MKTNLSSKSHRSQEKQVRCIGIQTEIFKDEKQSDGSTIEEPFCLSQQNSQNAIDPSPAMSSRRKQLAQFTKKDSNNDLLKLVPTKRKKCENSSAETKSTPVFGENCQANSNRNLNKEISPFSIDDSFTKKIKPMQPITQTQKLPVVQPNSHKNNLDMSLIKRKTGALLRSSFGSKMITMRRPRNQSPGGYLSGDFMNKLASRVSSSSGKGKNKEKNESGEVHEEKIPARKRKESVYFLNKG